MHQTTRKTLILGLMAVWLATAFCASAEAYIGPGAGFAFLGSFMALFVTIVLAFGTLLIWPIRAAFRMIWKRKALTNSHVDRLIILGLDGLDPVLAARFMNEGHLPNFEKLKAMGTFKPLATTAPSMSPVAWSSFTTGVDPSKHNIFDFLARDPRSYMSVLSSADIGGTSKTLKLGSFLLPLGKPKLKLLRKGIPFWKFLGDRRIFSSIIRVPITFPVEKFNGSLLAAMCVPDLRGTQGTFSFFTTENLEGQKEALVGVKEHVELTNDVLKTELKGPPNSMKEGNPELTCPFTVRLDRAARQAHFDVRGETFTLNEREYSPWVKVTFKPGLGIKVTGICKFYVMEMEPEFKLYVTPINIDPEKPALPISHPFFYAVYLQKRFGDYATLGLAEDTWALNERAIDEEAFLKQAYAIHEERETQFFDAIEKTSKGLVSVVFDATDRIQHMFMRYMDPTHPSNRDKDTEKHKDSILDLYRRMDDLLGRTMEKLGEKDMIMVISDHGFKTFRRGVNINSWLMKEGYLHLKEGHETSGDWFEAVDWSRTKAYCLGLTGMYINVKGREAHGIVEPGAEEQALKEELIPKLKGLYDEVEDKPAIREVYDVYKLYKGPYLSNSPDLLIGYEVGYRVSWDCAVGKVDDVVIEDNVKSWSGDHCIDPVLVPGIFFCNRPIDVEKPRLMDVGVTALKLFGVDVPPHMDGVPLIEGSPWKAAAPAEEKVQETPA